MIFILLLAAPCAAHAWSPFMKENGKVKKGNKLMAKGQAAKALAKYSSALGDLSDRSGVYFNKGVAHYKLAKEKEEARGENLQEAAKSLLSAIDLATDEEKDLRGKAFYNLGNVYYQGERWEEAAESYRQALKHLPGDKNAAFNLALALKKIEEQRKKEEEEKKKQQQEEEQKEKEKQEQEQQEKEQDDQQKEEEEEQQDQQEKQEDDQECDQGKEQSEQQEEQQKKGREKEEQSEQQQKQQQGEKQKQQGESQQKQQPPPQPVPMTKQQTEAILDALQRGEKNYHLEALKKYGKGKAKIRKDW